MKKAILGIWVLSALLTVGVIRAEAVSLWVDPASQTVDVGETAAVDIWIDGLGAGVPPTLTSWRLDVAFDGGILDFSEAFYGDNLGTALGMMPFVMTSTPGSTVRLQQISFEAALGGLPALHLNQPEGFSLAKLEMIALRPGWSPLTLSNVALTGFMDPETLPVDLPVSSLRNGEVNVAGSAPIPEPGTLVLLGAGLAGLGLTRRRRNTK